MKKSLLFLSLGASLAVNAQSEITDFGATGRGGVSTAFATDYQALGINPANLGVQDAFTDVNFALGLSETSFSIYSEALTKPELKGFFSGSMWDGSTPAFTYEEKQNAALVFTNAQLAVNLDMMHIGFAYQHETVGGFAFNIRERANWYSNLSKDAAEIMFMGAMAPYFDTQYDSLGMPTMAENAQMGVASNPKPFSEILDGSRIGVSYYREFNFGYGRSIIRTDNIGLYGGIGFKYLQGLGQLEVASENGELTAYTSMSPIVPFDYGTAADMNPSTDTTNTGLLPDPVGNGLGFDLGFTMELGEDLTFAASITDIGSMTWSGNSYIMEDQLLDTLENDGMDSYNVFTEVGTFAGDTNMFQLAGREEITTKLPTRIRFGAKYDVSEKISVGADMIIPGNSVINNYQSAVIMVGGDIQLARFLRISTGMNIGGNYGTNVPFGIVFGNDSGRYEAGISTRDITSFLKQNKPNLSVSFGFMRMRF